MSELAYAHGLAALQFFSFHGAAQTASWNADQLNATPIFFQEQREEDTGCDHFVGIGYVFITYAGALFNEFTSTNECKNLSEFHQRLNGYMFQGAASWSATAVTKSQNWDLLREDAKRALDELCEPVPTKPPTFNISDLINPDEFRTSKESRQLLDEL
jgi:hypothetical protein